MASNGVHISFVYCGETEREVIKMTISCSRSELGGKNICFFCSGPAVIQQAILYIFSHTLQPLNSPLYYMQWQAVGLQIAQVMSVEM